MELTTRDLGLKVEEITFRHEYRVHAVDGLPDDAKAVIIERNGKFFVHRLNVIVSVDETSMSHASLADALEKLHQAAA